jgi:phospholipase/carboxylesterase
VSTASTLEYLRREAAGEPEGALVLSHGRGVDANDLYPLLDALDPDARLLGIAPQGPLTDIPPGGRHWYTIPRIGFPEKQTFDASYGALAATLDSLLDDARIGWERTVLGGFSMGSVMSYALALGSGRPRPAGLLALNGYIPTVEGWEPDLASRGGLPVLIHHGLHDPIMPVQFARDAHALLSAAGLEVTYYETEAGHEIPPALVPRLRKFVADHT